jgi:hypothetical protein
MKFHGAADLYSNRREPELPPAAQKLADFEKRVTEFAFLGPSLPCRRSLPEEAVTSLWRMLWEW